MHKRGGIKSCTQYYYKLECTDERYFEIAIALAIP
jgi:hypothetical protein